MGAIRLDDGFYMRRLYARIFEGSAGILDQCPRILHCLAVVDFVISALYAFRYLATSHFL